MSAPPSNPPQTDDHLDPVQLQQELEELKADHVRQEVEHEQTVSDALARVAELERSLEEEKKGKVELKSKEEGLDQSLSHLRESYNSLQTSLATESSKASLLSTQLSSAEAQNRSLQGSFAALENERDRAIAEVAGAKEKAARWEAKVGELEGELEMRKVESRNFKFKVEAMELNLVLANKDNAALTDSLTRTTSDFARYRSSTQSQAQSASLELQNVQSALATSQSSLSQLTTSQTNLSNRLTASQSEISTLRTQLVEQKAAFKQDIATQQRLAQSAERRAEDARKRLEEVEQEWEDDLARRKEADVRSDEERLVWEDQRAELEAKVAELRDTVNRLVESGVVGGADNLPEDSEADQGAMLMSPSAALAGSLMRKRGVGISELYVENVRTKMELSKQKEETQRLEDSLAELLRDIQERAPLLRQQRQEYTRLVDTANDLASQLSAAKTQQEAEARRAADEASKAKQLQAAQVDLESHVTDLSRQVITLVREIGIRDEPFLAQYQHLDDADMNTPEGDDIDSVITRNLITFKSIPELQAQNQQLIKVVRELGKQLEAAEKTPGGDQAKAANGEPDKEALQIMDEAGDIILGLKAKVEEKELQLTKQTRERDLFAKMLSQAGLTLPAGMDLEAAAGAGGGLLDVVKRNLEDFRVELGIDSERLRAELAEARREVNVVSVSLVKVEAERDFLKDRIVALTEANNLQKTQFDGLVTQHQGVKTDLMRVNMELRSAEEKRIEVEGVAERVKIEAANLRAERDLWRATEEKLQKDVADVARDRAGLQALIESLRRAEAETLRVQEQTRLTSQQTIETLQKKSTELRRELAALSSKAASAVSLEAERDQARAALATSTEAAERAAADKATAEQQLQAAQASFEEEKAKYIGVERNRTAKIFTDNKRFFQEKKEWTTQEADLRAQLASLETRLTETDIKLAEALTAQSAASTPPTAEELEASVLSSEKYLALQNEKDDLQKAKDEALAAAASGAGSEEALKTLTNELETLKGELAAAKTAAETDKAAYVASERSRYTNVFNDNKRFRTEITQFKKDLEEAQARATAAEERAAAMPATADGDATTLAHAPSDEVIKSAVDEAVAKLNADHEATLAERERQLREELAASFSTPMDTDGSPSAVTVDAAVKAKEEELKAQHEAALLLKEMELKTEMDAAVKAAVESAKASLPPSSAPAVDVETAVKEAVAKREAELAAAHEEALKTASSSTADSESDATKAAVAKAVATVTGELTMKAGAQKNMLEQQKKKREKAEAEVKLLRAEMETLKSGSAPKVGSPAATTDIKPPSAAAMPVIKRPSVSAATPASDAAKTTPGGGPLTRTKAATVNPQASTSSPAKADASPTRPTDGSSIRGAARGSARGGRGAARGGRGAGAAGSPATRAQVAAGKDSDTPPARSLLGGALNQATSAAGGVKRKGTDEDSSPSSMLLSRLNSGKGIIKRPKTDKDGNSDAGGSS